MFEKFTLIAGPCVLEDDGLNVRIGKALAGLSEELGLPIVFKASYDKANRTSIDSFRGPGLVDGLEILAEVKREVGVPVLTDFHSAAEAARAAGATLYAIGLGDDVDAALLVDYGPIEGHIGQHLAGHAVYTRERWMEFHVAEVSKRFYGQDDPQSRKP